MSTITYKCPQCGGGLIFDPDSQKYQCEYCLTAFSQTEVDALEPDAEGESVSKPASDPSSDSSPVLYTCPSCGAEIVTDATTAATFCYYCHNPVVLSGRLEGDYEPDFVIPFAFSRENAIKSFTDWIRKKKFVPRNFYSQDQIEKLSGIYFPYWLFSCHVEGHLEAEGTKLRVWRTGDIEYTETQLYQISRNGSMDVKHVIRDALKKANKQLIEGVLPFEMEQAKDFSMSYLSGFQAENRDLDAQSFLMDVEKEVHDFASGDIRKSVGNYDKVNVSQNNTALSDQQWHYALLPVWTMTYHDKSKNKMYYYAMNGQNGRICGELPVDTKKLAGLFVMVFVPVFIIMLIMGYII